MPENCAYTELCSSKEKKKLTKGQNGPKGSNHCTFVALLDTSS